MIEMTMKLIDTYSEGDYDEVEVFECTECGRQHSVYSGGDISHCPCEFEREAEIEALGVCNQCGKVKEDDVEAQNDDRCLKCQQEDERRWEQEGKH